MSVGEVGGARLPPQNLGAERSVLGSCLRDNAIIGDVLQIVGEESFYLDANRKIFHGIVSLYGCGKPVDLVILADWLKGQNYLDDVGGPSYLADLWDAAPTAANAEHYARIVRDKFILRCLIHASTEILRDASHQVMPTDQLLEAAGRKILDIAQDGLRSQTKTSPGWCKERLIGSKHEPSEAKRRSGFAPVIRRWITRSPDWLTAS
jgi:replicative DNA helicase